MGPGEPVNGRAEQSVRQRLAEMQAELHAVASQQLAGERAGHTLQTTALVNEAYLRLAAQRNLEGVSKAQILAAAANTMRRVLVEYARKRKAAMRGGGVRVLALEDVEVAQPQGDIDVLALDEAIEKLKALSERAGQVVTMRFYAGMTVDEVAEVLKVSPRTVADDWTFARAWLKRTMAD